VSNEPERSTRQKGSALELWILGYSCRAIATECGVDQPTLYGDVQNATGFDARPKVDVLVQIKFTFDIGTLGERIDND
jgi:hypothetical protein